MSAVLTAAAKVLSDSAGFSAFLPLQHQEDWAPAQALSARWADLETIIVVATGGPLLCSQTWLPFAPRAARLHFLSGTDPYEFARLRQAITQPSRTAVVALSKSGETLEIITNFLLCLDALAIPHAAVMTESTTNTLAVLAANRGVPVLPCPKTIGGRYAIFSQLGMVVPLLAGLPVTTILDTARQALASVTVATIGQTATFYAQNAAAGRRTNVWLVYATPLLAYAQWWRQLWAESLGKDGKGVTPLLALGPVDQHSQLQLYLSGARDKTFTILTLPQLDSYNFTNTSHPQLHRPMSLAALHDTLARATAAALHDAGQPILEQQLNALTIPHYTQQVVETILLVETLGALWGIETITQPAVEAIKQHARALLA